LLSAATLPSPYFNARCEAAYQEAPRDVTLRTGGSPQTFMAPHAESLSIVVKHSRLFSVAAYRRTKEKAVDGQAATLQALSIPLAGRPPLVTRKTAFVYRTDYPESPARA